MGADVFLILVVLAVLASPFLPVMLKSKCPVCKKRKLEHLETINKTANDSKTFITYYRCHNCNKHFQQEKSGPLTQMAEDNVVQAAVLSA